MELQLSWPSGYYSLFAAKQNDGTFLCPEGGGFQWKQGNITDQHHIFFDTAEENKQKIGIQEVGHQALINFVIKYRELKCIFKRPNPGKHD